MVLVVLVVHQVQVLRALLLVLAVRLDPVDPVILEVQVLHADLVILVDRSHLFVLQILVVQPAP